MAIIKNARNMTTFEVEGGFKELTDATNRIISSDDFINFGIVDFKAPQRFQDISGKKCEHEAWMSITCLSNMFYKVKSYI